MTLQISQTTFRSKRALTIIGASLLVALSIAILAFPSRANNPATPGFLELDGNVVPGNCNGTTNCTGGTTTCAAPVSSSSTTDWACLFHQVSTFTGGTSPTAAQIAAAYVSNGLPANAVASSFGPDGYNSGPLCPTSSGTTCPDPTTYTSGSKDILDISSNTCASSNNLLAKDDLINTYGIKYIDPANGHQIAYIGDEKESNGGDNNIGVWFDANPISVPSPCPPGNGAPFVGSHAIGDILTVSNFTKGGLLAGINAYTWVGTGASSCPAGTSGSPPLCLKFTGNVCNPSGPSTQFVCGIVSHVTTAGVPDGSPSGNVCGFPWVTDSKELSPNMNNSLSAGTLHCTVVNSFYEMGIDLTALGFTSCRTNAIPETRSSQSLTATLFDFTILNLNSCATTTTTSSSQTGIVAPGTSVTDTATVTSTSGGGTPTGSVQFYFCGPTNPATSCAITPANAVGSPVPLAGGSATSGSESPTAVGFYCWSAAYIPSDGFLASQSNTTTNECFQVVAPTTTTTTSSTTALNIVPGTSETDSVTVAAVPASAGTPTGSVQFYVCGPTASATPCATAPGNALGSPKTLAAGAATSDAVNGASTPVNDNVPGFYCFSAVYTPDTSNFLTSGSTTTTNECFQVVNSIPKITAFGYQNTPTNNDPQTGSGTLVYTVTVTNYGTTSAAISGTLAITGSAVGTCTSSVGTVTNNSLAFSATLAAFGNSGDSKTFTLTCSYAGNSGDVVTATLNAMFTNVSGSGLVSGSPAGNFFTIEKT